MNYEVKGQIDKILPVQSGVSKATGDEWKKISFIVKNFQGYEGREQIFCFDIFGADKVDNFLKYNKEGAEVLVKFDIRTNKYLDKYFTNLSAFMVESGERVEQAAQTPEPIGDEEGLDIPF